MRLFHSLSDMKQLIGILMIISVFTIIVSPFTFAYEISGETVYIDDENVNIEATPHTLINSGWVYFNITSKSYTGNIDAVWGFDTSKSKPTKAEYWNGVNWIDISDLFDSINYNFDDKNKWYFITNQPITANVPINIRAWIETNPYANGKYDFAIKPSSETVSQAITNGHFYYIDPWWNATFPYRQPINVTVSDGSTLTNFQVEMRIEKNNTMQPDFDDLRFLNNCSDDATELDFFIESIIYTPITFVNVWVEVDTINTTICMYWGNAYTDTTSNGNETFLFFDDFEDYEIGSYILGQGGWYNYSESNTNKTTVVSDNCYRSDKCIKVTDVPTPQVNINHDVNNIENSTFIGYFKQNNSVQRSQIGIWDKSGSWGGYLKMENTGQFVYFDTSSQYNTGITYQINNWYRIKINITGNIIDYEIYDGSDFNKVFSTANRGWRSGQYVDGFDLIWLAAPAAYQGAMFDKFFLAKYREPMPTYAPGLIETNITEEPPTNITLGICDPELIYLCEPFDDWTNAECIDNETLRKTKECIVTTTEENETNSCIFSKSQDFNCNNGCYDGLTAIGSGCAPTDLEILGMTGAFFLIFVFLSLLVMGHRRKKKRR